MKKTVFFFFAFAALVINSCAKEMKPGDELSEVKTKTISLTITDDAAVKSAFDGTVISLSGNESFRVCYVDGEGKIIGSVKAYGNAGNYTFEVPEDLVVEDYIWYAAGPWINYNDNKGWKDISRIQAVESGVLKLSIPAVQTPGANTFDPAADEVVSNSFTVSSGAAVINQFKRISAPLLIKIKGLEDGEKIFAASLCADSSNGLTAKATISLSDVFAEAGAVSYASKLNNVAAVWQDGLAGNGEFWPVWLCVNPTLISAGSPLTLTVTTGTRTLSRTVNVGEMDFVTDKINTFSFNISGTDKIEKKTIAQGFMTEAINNALKTTGNNKSLAASDGSSYSWNVWKAASSTLSSGYEFDGIVNYALMCSAISGTFKGIAIPSVPGYDVTGLTCYMHPMSTDNSRMVQVYPADATAQSDVLPIAEGQCVGASASLQAPSETCLSGLKLCFNNTMNVVMVVLELQDATPVVSNDYKEIYDNGGEISIGSRTIRKADYGEAEVVHLADIANSKFSNTDKVYFIDDSETSEKVLSTKLNLRGIIIGRYKDRQPSIKSTATGSNYYSIFAGSAIKNVKLEIGSSGFFCPASADATIDAEDCTLIARTMLFREGNEAYRIKSSTIKNSIIQTSTAPMLGSSSAASAVVGTEDSFTFENCVITIIPDGDQPSYRNSNMFVLTSSGVMPETKFTLKNNTIIGFNGSTGGAALIYSNAIGGFDIDRNVIVGNWAAEKTNRVIKTSTDQDFLPSPTNISNNFFSYDGTTIFGATNGDSQKHWNISDHSKSLAITTSGNIANVTDSPFSSTDYVNGYFPINASVVTNGAGASFDTKFWRSW